MMNDSDSCVGGGRWKRWFCCVDDIGGLFLVVLYDDTGGLFDYVSYRVYFFTSLGFFV